MFDAIEINLRYFQRMEPSTLRRISPSKCPDLADIVHFNYKVKQADVCDGWWDSRNSPICSPSICLVCISVISTSKLNRPLVKGSAGFECDSDNSNAELIL